LTIDLSWWEYRHLGNLTIEQQSKLDRFAQLVQKAGYIDRTDDATLVS